MEGLFVLMSFLSIFSMIAFIVFTVVDITGPNSIIQAFFLQRKLLKLLDPKTNITKENLRERKMDMKFLEDLLEEGYINRPPVKIFVEKLLLSHDLIIIDTLRSIRDGDGLKNNKFLKINEYSGMNKNILREIIKSWSSHIETLEAEDNLEKEIELILSEEIENAEKEASLQKSPTKRSKRNTEVHAAQDAKVSYR